MGHWNDAPEVVLGVASELAVSVVVFGVKEGGVDMDKDRWKEGMSLRKTRCGGRRKGGGGGGKEEGKKGGGEGEGTEAKKENEKKKKKKKKKKKTIFEFKNFGFKNKKKK